MSCCNHPHPGVTIVYPPCPTDCPDTNTITAENINLAGYGVLDSFEDNYLAFRGVSSADGYITVNINDTNKTIEIGLDPEVVNGSLPDATESIKGKIALATAVEAQAGLNDEKAVTPLKLALVTATVARRGLVELATSIETEAGVDNTRAVTPEGLNFTLSNYIPPTEFADAAARNLAVPQFIGQLGLQQNTGVIYYANGLDGGDWESGNLDSPDISGTVNFIGNTWQINSVDIPANSVVITTGTAGVPSSALLSTFVRTSGTSTSAAGMVIDVTNPSSIEIRNGGVTILEVGNGSIKMGNLPTADPTLENALWNDAGTLKVSAG